MKLELRWILPYKNALHVGEHGPAVKGTLWTRIGLGLVHYGLVLGIEQFLIKRTLSRSFTRTHASTPARKHTPV